MAAPDVVTFRVVRTSVSIALFAAAFLAACSPPKPAIPPLSPEVAQQLIRYDTRATNHLKFVQSQMPGCEYVLHLPDQASHPQSVEVDHIVSCGGRTDLKAYDASAEFQWNQAQGHWELYHFGS